jgi:hypothetical protein
MRATFLGGVFVLSLAVGVAAQSADAPVDTTAWCMRGLSDLSFDDGQPQPLLGQHPWVALDGEGEAWIAPEEDSRDAYTFSEHVYAGGTLAIRVPARRDITGRLFPGRGGDNGRPRAFRIPKEQVLPEPTSHSNFLRVVRNVCEQRIADGDAGAAWWRHLRDDASRQLHEPQPSGPHWHPQIANLDDTLSLLSGGRAVAENLQLDRMLPATPDPKEDESQDVAGIKGIEVAAYDWSAAIAGKTPALDPLAALVPADQHALFFPSFTALVEMGDRLDAEATAVLGAFAEPAEEAGTRARYERQLGLPMSDVARVLGPKLIRSVAFTGGDPDLRSGSDVAVLFEPVEPAALLTLLLARVSSATAAPGVESRSGTLEGVEWQARVSPDRAVSSYVARLGDTVVVSNSLAQLQRLVSTLHGKTPALAAAPEYAFFRDRYPRGDAAETALLVLSDTTIRRWCGPRWRIGSSRRVRAEAELAELQAATVDAAVHGTPAQPGPVMDPPPGLGEVMLTPDGVRSSIYGTLGFLTPVAELDLDKVSESEAALYGRWRDGYQQNWSGKFDPIAVRFDVGPGRMALDLSVRPLITASDFRDFVEITRGAEIAPQACDPHPEALLQVVMAVNPKSSVIRDQASMLSMLMPKLDALGWLGSSVSWYCDDDPFWSQLVAAEDREEFLKQHQFRIPVGLHAEVKEPLLLTAALVALHGLADSSAPGMTEWANDSYRDEPFVVVKPSASAVAEEGVPDGLSLRYSPSATGLLVTLDPALMERALARRIERRDPAHAPQTPDWLGKSLCVRLDGKALPLLASAFEGLWGGMEPSNELRDECFANLPILNEWHRLFPGADPVATHEHLFHRTLTCPGGGSYRWNEAWQTMESTVYGHPGAPLDGPTLPPGLLRLTSAQAGLTFEDDGLRARVELIEGAK